MCRPLGFQGCFNLRPVADATGKDVSPSGLGKISVPALLLLDGSISLASLEVNLQSNVWKSNGSGNQMGQTSLFGLRLLVD